MSLYNLVCGNNPLYTLLHAILSTEAALPDIPRYRDTFTRLYGDALRIVIHTRTGGGNREGYAEENAALAQHPLYLGDSDDEFDSTFADFEFAVPPQWSSRVKRLHELLSSHSKFCAPREKFARALDNMNGTASEIPALVQEAITEAVEIIAAMSIELGLIAATKETAPG